MLKKLLILAFIGLPATQYAQNVGIGTNAPNTSALLEIASETKGVLLPRVPLVAPNNAAPFSNPPLSLLLFNTSFNQNISRGFFYWNGLRWLRLTNNEDAWTTTGNAGTNAQTHFIGTTDDISLSFRIRNVQSGLIDSNINRTTFGFATARPAGGIHNSAFGFKALSGSSSQSLGNTAIGSRSMELSRRGSFNAGLGMNTLLSLDSGRENTGMGAFALASLATGSANTAVGGSALSDLVQGDSNTVAGFRATVKTQVSRSTAIGALATVSRSDAIVLGSVPGENQATRGVFVGIGTTNPQYKLHIVDGNSTGVNPSGNSTLLLDKAGGSNHLSMLVDASSEAALVFGKSGSVQPPFDGGIFYNSGGQGAMQFRNNGGFNRMVIHNNGNLSFGSSNNIARFFVALGTPSALTPFSNSTLVLDGGTASHYLNMLSNGSEQGLLFGNNLSNRDGGLFYSGTDRAFSFRTANTSNRMVIDATGQVGIGTSAPANRLHVSTNDTQNAGFRQGILIENTASGVDGQGNINTGEAAISFKNAGENGTGNNQWIVGLNQNRNMAFAYGNDFNASATRMVLDSTGNLGIGVSAPTFQLQLSQNSAAKPGSNTWTVSSDVRLKKDMRPFTDGMEVLEKINPIWFTYTGAENHPQQEFVGTTAQALQQVAPYMVTTLKKKSSVGDNLLGVDYGPLQFMMVNALKEQQALIKNQQLQIDSLLERLSRLERKLSGRAE